jgi:outer membrane biosynthesis protein TonB
MAEKRFLRPFVIVALAALVGLLAALVAPSMTWATSHEKPRTMDKKPTMKPGAAPAETMPAPVLTTPTPTTLEDYTSHVQDRLQLEAMKVKTPGTADVRLTIGRDGSVRQAEVLRLEGPPELRNQITSMVTQLKLPPLPPAANADTLVVDSTLAFNYPGGDLLDRFGRQSGSR